MSLCLKALVAEEDFAGTRTGRAVGGRAEPGRISTSSQMTGALSPGSSNLSVNSQPDMSGRTQEVSMAKGYWVSVYRAISDPERLTAYDKLAGLAVQAAGGRVLSSGGRVVAHEAGNTHRVVLIEFNSFDQAVAAYESEAYQQALVVLSGCVERDFRIIEGTD
ncbi:Uncharacterized conserved protein, DUF1330 family [Streptomyces sp. 136MFCol5.1]|nr:Uncharacterized conserved protein, DUF1330 family [Streptomyces sp. 136MFCol5.1]